VNLVKAYIDNQHVRAKATLCGDPSPLSAEQVVQIAPLPLATPTFAPFVQGGNVVVVQGLADGARFELKRNGVSLGIAACWGGTFTWQGIAPPIAGPGADTFEAAQQLCPGDPWSPPGKGDPLPCSALRSPKFGPVQDGDITVTFTNFVAGSRIKVFVNGVKEGDGSGPVISLNQPIPHNATIDAWQSVGTCVGSTVEEIRSKCVAPPESGDPSALDLFPIGTHEYNAPATVSFDGFTYNVHGSIYYPAEDDGVDQPFNIRLAKLGRVPLIVLVHGRHGGASDSYLGYDYFQAELARMGFIAMSVDESQTDGGSDGTDFTGNIVRRAELAIESIRFMQTLDASGPIFKGVVDFSRVGLMGHSRGGDCVLAVAERVNLPGAKVCAVISLAPVDSGAHSGHPKNIAFMTILPAGDGDVIDNDGAKFYDQAEPAPFKTQLYVDQANHNYFNRRWANDDSLGKVALMSRFDHERILSTYGCAFFRNAVRGDPTFGYLDHSVLPAGVQNQNIHLSIEVAKTRIVDDYEGHSISSDNEAQATAQIGVKAGDFSFSQGAGAFNPSFFGRTTGNVLQQVENIGSFREPLHGTADLSQAEVWVRAAEVYQTPTIQPAATGFRIGLEDDQGTIAWLDVDDVGGLARPFERHALDAAKGAPDLIKTMLSTHRFPGHCFVDPNGKFDIHKVSAIHLGLNRGDKRPIAFDGVEIVQL
jgi:dienelactone hydrolase